MNNPPEENNDSVGETSGESETPSTPDEAPTLALDNSDVSDKPAGNSVTKKTALSVEQGTVTERPGDTIGPYKLLQQIGEGGFGVVYMAEQRKPIKRKVALKIIKPGMDTKEVIARFEAERQALALMDHPHIAKVLDVGATETGRPYFAMELVKGVSVTEYCDNHRLDTKQRLALFQDICGAVQHAHQKGVIHRDIKPNNILVTLHDTKPVVKIIDFGIAKAISQELTEKTLFTAFGQMIGTPQYMSPEQSEMSGLDVDTRSDIYSLGVVLYELLTGRTPLDPKRLRQAGLDEIHRLIREEEPPKPLTRITSLENDEITVVAKAHNEAPEKLSRLVRGDLDWIVMKALEKDRSRRYETATGFAEDIRRYLDDEAVLASPPSTSYRLSKFARRNKAVIATGGVILGILIAAVVVSTWQAKVAWQAQESEAEQRKFAETSAEEAKAVLSFFQDKVLSAARPKEQAGGLGIDATIREAIDAAEPKIGEVFKERPLVEASIRTNLGATYLYLGEVKEATQQLQRVLELRKKALGPMHLDTLSSMHFLAISYAHAGSHNEALKLREETLALTTKILGAEHPHTLSSMGNLAASYRKAGRHEEALALEKETLALTKKVLGPEHLDALKSMSRLATFYVDAGSYDKALELFEETLALEKVLLGPEHPGTLMAMGNLALSYGEVGRHEEALTLNIETLALTKKVLGPEHPDTLTSMSNLALSYLNVGRYDEALALREESLKMRKKELGPEHPDTLLSMNNLAFSYGDAGRHEEALTLNKETLKMRKKVMGPEHPDTLKSMSSLAHRYLKSERLEEAEKLYRQYIYIRQSQSANDWRFYYTHSQLGVVLTDQKKYAEAEPFLLAGKAGLERTVTKEDEKWLKYSIESLADLYTYWGKPDKAAEWEARLKELDQKPD